MDTIERRKLFELKPHPKNNEVFGDPRLVPEYAEIKESIRQNGLQEPIIIKRDGTILSGHLRYSALMELALESGKLSHEADALVRVHPEFIDKADEFAYLFAANIERRQLSPKQIASAYKALLDAADDPKAKKKKGFPLKVKRQVTRERIARMLNVSLRVADNVSVIFQTPGVPADILELVEAKALKVPLVADAVRYAIKEALRRDPNLENIEVNPVDVQAYIHNPPVRKTTVSDIIRGVKPVSEPVMVEDVPITTYATRFSSLPAPFSPKQKITDMVLNGVEWSERGFCDRSMPLHEAINRVRQRLHDAFEHTTVVREEKVDAALDALLERITQYMRVTGKRVSVHISESPRLHERLLALRACLEEEDPDLDLNTHRNLLTDIAAKARERSLSLRRHSKAKITVSLPKPKKLEFNSEVEFILSVIGEDTLVSLSPN